MTIPTIAAVIAISAIVNPCRARQASSGRSTNNGRGFVEVSMGMGLTIWLNGGGGHGIGDGGFGDHTVWGGGHGALDGGWSGLVHHHGGRRLIYHCIGLLNDHGGIAVVWRADSNRCTVDGGGLHGFAGGHAGNVASRWINNRSLVGARTHSGINHHNRTLINNNRYIAAGGCNARATINHVSHIGGIGGVAQ